MLLANSNSENEAIFAIAVIALIFFAIFLVRVLIHRAANSGKIKPLAIIMIIACVFSFVPLVMAIVLNAMELSESYDGMSIVILWFIIFGCEFVVTFIFTSCVGTITSCYKAIKMSDDWKTGEIYDAESKSNTFWRALLTSLIVGIVVSFATLLLIDYTENTWYSFFIVIIPTAIVFVPTFFYMLECIDILRHK